MTNRDNCYCSECQSSGIPCPPGTCPNVPTDATDPAQENLSCAGCGKPINDGVRCLPCARSCASSSEAAGLRNQHAAMRGTTGLTPVKTTLRLPHLKHPGGGSIDVILDDVSVSALADNGFVPQLALTTAIQRRDYLYSETTRLSKELLKAESDRDVERVQKEALRMTLGELTEKARDLRTENEGLKAERESLLGIIARHSSELMQLPAIAHFLREAAGRAAALLPTQQPTEAAPVTLIEKAWELCICGHQRADHSPEKALCRFNSCGGCECFEAAPVAKGWTPEKDDVVRFKQGHPNCKPENWGRIAVLVDLDPCVVMYDGYRWAADIDMLEPAPRRTDRPVMLEELAAAMRHGARCAPESSNAATVLRAACDALERTRS